MRPHELEIFEPLLSLETPQVRNNYKLFEPNTNFQQVIITPLIKREPFIEPPISTMLGRTSVSHQPDTSNEEKEKNELGELKEMIRSLSLRI